VIYRDTNAKSRSPRLQLVQRSISGVGVPFFGDVVERPRSIQARFLAAHPHERLDDISEDYRFKSWARYCGHLRLVVG
jgi:hypothetical protein